MNIVLVAINTKFIHSNLAVYALRAYAKAKGEEVTVCEYTINHDADAILQDLYERKPDVVAFSCYLWNYVYINELTKELSRLLPGLPIWLGGPEVTYESESHLEAHPEVKGILVGEGEASFYELCRFYRNGGSLSEINGIVYREGTRLIRTGIRECLDMADLPFPYEDLSEMKHKILYYESSRGCPFSCSYCLSSVDRKLRFKPLEKVYEELQAFLDARVPQVKFVDRTYNAKVEHALAIWNYIREHDNGVTNFHFEIAADILRQEEIDCLQSLRPGLVQLEIGVQTTNPATLTQIHRSMDIAKVWKVTEELKKNRNINLHLDLIAGLPEEGYERFQQSFDELFSLRPHQLQLGFLKVLKGSYMFAHAEEYGLVYHERPPYEIMRNNWLSFDEIIALKRVEQMVETYYNSGQFSTMLGVYFCREKAHVGKERPYDFFYGLAQHLLERRELALSHGRVRRYELLLSYLDKLGEPRELYEEAAICDLYLRENLKSRPEFAPDLCEQEKVLRKKRGKIQHVETFSYDFSEGEFYSFARMPEKTKCELLFDYEDRSPVTGNVKMERFTNDEEGTLVSHS